jgi:Superinfection immunity protein
VKDNPPRLSFWIAVVFILFVLVLMFMDSPPEGQFLTLYFVGAVVFLLVYSLPASVAYHRHHRQRLAILALNILLGWSFLGWIIAMVWACTNDLDQNHPAGAVTLPQSK